MNKKAVSWVIAIVLIVGLKLIRNGVFGGDDDMNVTFYAYFDDQQDATSFGTFAEERNLSFEINPPEDELPQWSVILTTNKPIDFEQIYEIEESLTSAATNNHGELDGYEIQL